MKKQKLIGVGLGISLGAAAAIAGRKVVNEIKTDLNECSFISPNGENAVTLTYGSSKFAKGLTFIKVKGSFISGGDECKLVLFAKNGVKLFNCEWKDDEHFVLLVGTGKCKQCCDVSFKDEKIIANYYLIKDEDTAEDEDTDNISVEAEND